MLNAKKIINDSNIAFGTSGARGLVIDFSHDVCAAFTHAFLSVIGDKYNFNKVALAIDNRQLRNCSGMRVRYQKTWVRC